MYIPKSFRGSCFFLNRTWSKRTNHGRADLHPLWVCKLFKHSFESRIRFTNTLGVLNDRFAISEQTRYGKRHCNTMVAKARHPGSAQRRRTQYFEAIVHFSYLHSHSAQVVRDRSDAIAFFYAQFFRLPNNRLAVCEGTGDCKGRQFINKLRHFFTLNDSALKRKTGHFNNSARLDLVNIFNSLTHLRTHSKQNTEERRSCVVQTNIANKQMTSSLCCGGNEPKSCR